MLKVLVAIASMVLLIGVSPAGAATGWQPGALQPASASAKPVVPSPKPVKAKPTDSRLRLTAISYTGIGPLLSAVRADIAYKRVYKHSQNPIMNGLYGQVSAGLTASPSMVGLNVEGEWLPLAILRLRASYTAQYYTGYASGLGHGLAFVDANSAYDGQTLDARTGEEESDLSHRALFTLTLRFKFGKLLFFSDNELAGWYYPETSGGQYAYETYYDGLIRRGVLDGTFMNRTALLYEAWKGEGDANFRLGVVNQYVLTFDTGSERLRTGGILLWTPRHKLWGMSAPTLVVMSGATLDHRYREGDFWAEIALVFNWDFRP